VIKPDAVVIGSALLLDLVIGDPRWLPHPVIMIGNLIKYLEKLLRSLFNNERFAGVLLLLLTTGASAGASWLLLEAAGLVSALFSTVVAVILSSTCLAARSLHGESALVAAALDGGNLAEARLKLSYIVGRDTENLEAPEIWRALIETVAENTSDGIIAPLFWLSAGGPVAAMAFKAVSTLDSMVGYKNDRYINFGWASARMDDLLNFIPARLTALLIIISAPLCGLSMRESLRVTLRDRHNHPSPNSAHPESAAAGALRIRLGGTSSYGGRVSQKQFIGDPVLPIDGRAYRNMIRLMYLSTLIMAFASIVLLLLLKGFYVPQL
jgi:adenosylcobinamide-phosphate synthase